MIRKLAKEGVVIEPEALKLIKGKDEILFQKLREMKNKPLVITKEFIQNLLSKPVLIKKAKLEGKISIKEYIAKFNEYYNILQKMLLQKPKLKNTISIHNAKGRCVVIGMYYESFLQDPTGRIKLLQSNNILNGDVVGVIGKAEEGIFKPDEIIFPDVKLVESQNLLIQLPEDGFYRVNESIILKTSFDLTNMMKKLNLTEAEAAIELLKRRRLKPPITIDPQPHIIFFTKHSFETEYKGVKLIGCLK